MLLLVVLQLEECNRKCEAALKEKDANIADLEEQVRDLMFMIESQAKVDALPEEAREELRAGKMVMTSAGNSGGGGAGRGGGRGGSKRHSTGGKK